MPMFLLLPSPSPSTPWARHDGAKLGFLSAIRKNSSCCGRAGVLRTGEPGDSLPALLAEGRQPWGCPALSWDWTRGPVDSAKSTVGSKTGG